MTVRTEYEVVLLRHGETVGYDGDHGLTARGRAAGPRARRRAGLGAQAGHDVRMPHARTARGIATAVTLRAALVAALGGSRSTAPRSARSTPSRGSTTFATRCTARASTVRAVTARLALPTATSLGGASSTGSTATTVGGRRGRHRSSTGCTTRRSSSSRRTCRAPDPARHIVARRAPARRLLVVAPHALGADEGDRRHRASARIPASRQPRGRAGPRAAGWVVDGRVPRPHAWTCRCRRSSRRGSPGLVRSYGR